MTTRLKKEKIVFTKTTKQTPLQALIAEHLNNTADIELVAPHLNYLELKMFTPEIQKIHINRIVDRYKN